MKRGRHVSASGASHWRRFYNPLACLLIVAAGLAAYANSLQGPFIFDDFGSTVENPTIRHLWPVAPVLSPPGGGVTVQGRPMLNLSLAVNWAIGQEKVFSYHVLNLAIHLAAALLLFGIVRRTLLQPRLVERFGQAATGVAFAAALLWTVHPLATEAVTYIVQRAESLMGMFYLLALYCVIRGADAHGPARSSVPAVLWYALSVMACLAGMATKEVMLSAPLVVLLYDRTFLAGSFKAALRRRWPLYAALACTWGLLAFLVAASPDRGGTAGAAIHVTTWQYASTEPGVILHYLRLAFWPTGLVLDYGWPFVRTLGDILPGAIAVSALLGATLWALRRRPAAGLLGASFFLILAPSSSIIALADPAFEHRMYLALAPVISLAVALLYLGWQKIPHPSALVAKAAPAMAIALAAAALGYGTHQRNKDYRSELAIWQDVVAKRPENAEGYTNLGIAMARLGRVNEAILNYQRALQIKPDNMLAHYNLAGNLVRAGNTSEAITHYERAVQLKGDYAQAHFNLAALLAGEGKFPEAIAHYERAVQLKSDYPEAENNLGIALASSGKVSEAVVHFERALQLKPDYASAQKNLAHARAMLAK